MPLITFTGLPSSGKTKWATQLMSGLQEKIEGAKETGAPGANMSVVYHSDETLGIAHTVYEDSGKEKQARGGQISAVRRDLSRTNIVILDSLSYIKGFRYQLFCEAKGLVTPHCVVHVVNPVEKCLEWNSVPAKEDKWDGELIKMLNMRYEEPNGDSRWDSPLFTIISADEHENLPLEDMWDALVLKKAPPPNAATLVKATSGTSFLQEMDRKTREVIQKIISHQQDVGSGGRIPINEAEDIYVDMPTENVSTAQLHRIRRSYIALNRMRSVEIDRIIPLFAEYVDKTLNNSE